MDEQPPIDRPAEWRPGRDPLFPWRGAGSVPDPGAELVGTVEAPGVAGDRVEFVTLPDGSLLVEDERGDEDLSPLAEAVEQQLAPPYRAVGVREGDRWSVGAVPLDVRELPGLPGDEVTLVLREGGRELTVDGEPSDAPVPGLEALAEDRAGTVVSAQRLDGDWWEVRVDRL